jgi:signal transduction histidine kinase
MTTPCANDPVLRGLRELRALAPDDLPSFGRRLLERLAAATSSTSVRLEHSHFDEALEVGARNAASLGREELAFSTGDGGRARLVFERSAAPFEDEALRLAEILGGEVVLRFEQARAENAATHRARQLELLRALTRAGTEVLRLSEAADRAAREILSTFAGVHVSLHVLRDDHLELIARRFPGGSRLDTAPDWLLRMPLADRSMQAVAVSEQRMLSLGIEELPERARAVLAPLGVRHLLVVPLMFERTGIGCLTVAHRRDEPWDSEGVRLLESAAAQLGVALAHVRLFEDERRRARDLGLLNELGSLVAQHLELSAVLATAVTQLSRITEVQRVHVFLPDAGHAILTSVACTTEEKEAPLAFAITSNAAVIHAFRTKQPVLVEDAKHDDRTHKLTVAALGTRALLCVPLIYKGEPIGVIALVETRYPKRFNKAEIERTTAVANLVSPAIANAKMYDDLRRSYEALGRAQAELVTHERLAALGELSAVIAHEVRNPLAVIFNSVGSLRRLTPSAGDAGLLLDIVDQEATRLNRIVGELLDFVRPYSSHPRPGRLDLLVHGAVEAARRAAADENVDVKMNLRVGESDVLFDETMLQQALINLIVNAMQATPRGGTVTVDASAETHEGQTRLRCDIVDEGSGVDPSDGRIFEPFFTTKATGTGLGLTIVRRIAAELGGSVHVARAPRGGSVFSLLIPLAVAVSPVVPR